MVALGGGAYAVELAPNNSVVSSSVKDQALKNKDIEKDTIKSGRLQDNGIRTTDIRQGHVRGPDIRAGEVRNSDIRDGHVRAAELGTIVERSETVGLKNGETGGANVQCNAGEQVTGGGAAWASPERDAYLNQSQRVENGWTATGQNETGPGTKELTVTALCLAA